MKITGEDTKEKLIQLVELYSDAMFTRAYYKTSNKEAAEDLVQETFLACVEAMDGFEGRSDIKTWLFSILNNKINDYYRKSYKNPELNEQQLNNNSTYTDHFFNLDGLWQKNQRPNPWDAGEKLITDDDFIKVLQRCLGELPATWHTAIQLKYIEEKKGETICQDLEISPTNFWQILHRSRLQLRKCLEVHWFKK